VLLLPAVVGWGRGAVQCQILGGGVPAQENPPPPNRASRPEEQTYLTLPEWYIVYSADEYAAFLADHNPSGFPYFTAVWQFWEAYYDVCTVTRDRYPFNADTQLMLAVIGVSFTAENMVKGIYENTVGRAAEWTSSGGPTPEEEYGRQVAAEYGRFLHTIPWYNFAFWPKIEPLWSTSLAGPNVVRKAERRLALTTEYAIKGGYGWIIKQGTESVYAPEDLEILARVEGVTPDLLQQESQLTLVEASDTQPDLVSLPRYEAFTVLVPKLVERGVRFFEIAGNDEIMITVLAPRDWRWSPEHGDLLFSLPIPSRPDRTRLAVRVPIASLHTTIGSLARAAGEGVTLEHIYDY
jgi:hypothetical protein